MTREDFMVLSKDDQIEWFRKNNQRELFELINRLRDPNYRSLIDHLIQADDDKYKELIESEFNYYEIKK